MSIFKHILNDMGHLCKYVSPVYFNGPATHMCEGKLWEKSNCSTWLYERKIFKIVVANMFKVLVAYQNKIIKAYKAIQDLKLEILATWFRELKSLSYWNLLERQSTRYLSIPSLCSLTIMIQSTTLGSHIRPHNLSSTSRHLSIFLILPTLSH